MTTLQEVIGSIEFLADEDKEQLFEMLYQRRIEERRAEILENAQEVRQAFKEGKAKVGTIEDLIANLLENDDYFNQVKAVDGTVAWPHEQDIYPAPLYLDSLHYNEQLGS